MCEPVVQMRELLGRTGQLFRVTKRWFWKIVVSMDVI